MRRGRTGAQFDHAILPDADPRRGTQLASCTPIELEALVVSVRPVLNDMSCAGEGSTPLDES